MLNVLFLLAMVSGYMYKTYACDRAMLLGLTQYALNAHQSGLHTSAQDSFIKIRACIEDRLHQGLEPAYLDVYFLISGILLDKKESLFSLMHHDLHQDLTVLLKQNQSLQNKLMLIKSELINQAYASIVVSPFFTEPNLSQCRLRINDQPFILNEPIRVLSNIPIVIGVYCDHNQYVVTKYNAPLFFDHTLEIPIYEVHTQDQWMHIKQTQSLSYKDHDGKQKIQHQKHIFLLSGLQINLLGSEHLFIPHHSLSLSYKHAVGRVGFLYQLDNYGFFMHVGFQDMIISSIMNENRILFLWSPQLFFAYMHQTPSYGLNLHFASDLFVFESLATGLYLDLNSIFKTNLNLGLQFGLFLRYMF